MPAIISSTLVENLVASPFVNNVHHSDIDSMCLLSSTKLRLKRRYAMPRRMSSKEAREHFSDLLGSVYYTKEPVIVEKKGKPVAVVISPEQYEAFQKEEQRLWRIVDQIRDRNVENDPDEVLRDVTSIVEDVRKTRYE